MIRLLHNSWPDCQEVSPIHHSSMFSPWLMTICVSYKTSKQTVACISFGEFIGGQRLWAHNCGGGQTQPFFSPWKVGWQRDTFRQLWLLTWPACSSLRGRRPNGSKRKDGGRRKRRSQADLIHRFVFFIGHEANRKWILISLQWSTVWPWGTPRKWKIAKMTKICY